jgi:hypothetical protein
MVLSVLAIALGLAAVIVLGWPLGWIAVTVGMFGLTRDDGGRRPPPRSPHSHGRGR